MGLLAINMADTDGIGNSDEQFRKDFLNNEDSGIFWTVSPKATWHFS